MKLNGMVGVSAVIFSFFLGSQTGSAAIWYDITGPYGDMGATVKVGELHIDESPCQDLVPDGCTQLKFIGTQFTDPHPHYSFDFHIPDTAVTYTSADLVAAGYGIDAQGRIEINGILADDKTIDSSVAENMFTIAGFDVMYEAAAAPADPPSAVPLPAALPLYGSALAIVGAFGWARRRQARPGAPKEARS